MSPAAFLTVIATVLAAEETTVRIDRGLVHGLRAGDLGRVYYELTVGESKRRIDVGEGKVVSTGRRTAVVSMPVGKEVRPGYSIEFEVPQERLSPKGLPDLESRLAPEERDKILRAWLESQVPRDDRIEAQIIQLLEERRGLASDGVTSGGGVGSDGISKGPRPTASSVAETARFNGSARMVRVPGGLYDIGLDDEEAEFYNQQPRFYKRLEPFRMDARPVTRRQFLAFAPHAAFSGAEEGFATGVSYAEAESYCRSQGKRLPNEFEWEVALQFPRLEERIPVYEWTSSWYLPYPGNDVAEKDYGTRFKVLRGDLPHEGFDSRRRRFMSPTASDWQVGFRCARTESASAVEP